MQVLYNGLIGLCALGVAGTAGAAGFELGEQGTRPLGTALAGIGTGTEELSAAFWNPAGMAADPRPGVAAGGSVVSPAIEFSGDTPDGGDAGRDGYPPQVYLRDQMGKDLILGFALNAPFGLRTEYDADWAGRYHAIESDLQVIQGTLSVAKEVGNGLSLGGGFVIQQLDVTLTNAVDFGGQGDGPTRDGNSKITGDSHGYGWMLGALWEQGATKVGVAYHSSVVHDISGSQRLETPVSPPNTLPASTRLDLPGRLIVGIRHSLTPNWRAMASAQWTEWSTYDQLKVEVSGSDNVVKEKKWEDVWSFAVGTEYDLSDRWMISAGYRFEQTPVPDKEHRDPRLPDSDRQRFAVGGSYAWGGGWSADVAYNYMPFGDAKIDNPDGATGGPAPTTLNGAFDLTAHVLSAQVNKRF